MQFSIIPLAAPPPPNAVQFNNLSAALYQAYIVAALSNATVAGATEPNLATALTNALSRYNPPSTAYSAQAWQPWYMDSTIRVS